MSNPVAEALWRNAGNHLTPELIAGLLLLQDQAERLATDAPPLPLTGPWAPAIALRPSTKRLVLDDHLRVAEWVAAQTGCSADAWAGYVCLGLEDEQGNLLAGVVMESYNGRNANVHIAGIGKNWLNRNMLTTFFHYCFNHLGMKRLTGLVPASNLAALAFDQHVGFKLEHTLTDGAPDGDLHILCLRREDCRFLPLAGVTMPAHGGGQENGR